jgi:hypothetical protein
VEWERIELSHNSLQNCRSAELSYHPEISLRKIWLRRRELNPRTFAYEANALPAELLRNVKKRVAGLAGLEPAPTRLEDERSCPSELQTRVNGGDGGSRTRNMLCTKQPLYQLELRRRCETGR